MDKPVLTNEPGKTPDSEPDPADAGPQKKKFMTPEISVPVDVLEATTFFQTTDSGQTNP
ncbi:MAG TPA: hypothetical protein VJT71_01430 [Pyrinomonadaceae bacterium]|nr:hypothetical protein [Pyrinomonadaceae bacterium]